MSAQLTNPFDDSNEKLKKKIILHMKSALFNEEMNTLMADTYVNILRQESIVFTRNEKRQMYQAVLREIFDEILADI